MGIPLVALGVKPPQIENYQDMQARAAGIQNMRGQNALQPGQLEEQKQQIKATNDAMAQRDALNTAYKSAMTIDQQGQPQIDTNGLSKALALSGHGSAIPGILDSVTKFQESKAKLVEQMQKNQEGEADLFGHAAAAIKQANYDPNVAHTILNELPSNPKVQALRQIVDTKPDQFRQLIDTTIAQSPAQQKFKNATDVATIRANTQKEGELPLGDKVQQLNQGLARRFQVLNPGQALPADFTLPANATQKDFDRIDKLLGQTEGAQNTKANQENAQAQRRISNEMRKQTLAMSQQTHADAQAAKSSKPVLAFDKDNKAHLLSMGDAQNEGLTGITEATPKQIDDAKTHTVVLNDMQTKLNDVVNAKGALDQGPVQRAIISKVLSHAEPGMINDTVKSMALSGASQQTKDYIQSVLSLKESALGLPKEITGGSRTSEIQGNALFQTLPSGSSVDSKYALQQAQKFQANIERLRERVPQVRGLQGTSVHPDLTGKPATATGAPLTATGPNGHKIVVKDGKWVDAQTGAPVQ